MANVQSLERALHLLNTLSDYPDGLQIARLSEQVGLSKSTTHRLLATLTSMNYVTKDPDTDRYKLGLQTLYITRNLINNGNIPKTARPYLKKLSQELNETVHLCVEDKGEIVYIDKIESNQTIQMFSRIGSRAPMYSTALGKVLLAGLKDEQLDQFFKNTPLEAITSHTTTSESKIREEIQQIKAVHYAIDHMENEEHLRCIAAPIYDQWGKAIASFSVAGPIHRITTERVEQVLIEKVTECSRVISSQFGYTTDAAQH
ncbi:IclR family transcriptional regulator [Aureibacillus halotolerans]|uniref:Glycerol operon regulatory protein n=1 Tax=Aureibacillus halotolerans TaxID=1508390 RepID=A0A4R6U8N0_9BACI|nr:IclR family transcriptional regulator [Aureibacillus halotolerans]TDQ42940.1 IclR family transcriptional regulator [Aureibacillus halotolerans]